MKSAVGLVVSILSCFFCGWIMSFNVISVELKYNFNLTQTQVALLASINSTGGLAFMASAILIKLLGFKYCYVISIVLVTSSHLLLSWAVSFDEFVKDWTLLFGLLLGFNSSAYILALQCSMGIGVLKISKRHTGKFICFYTAALALGKSYYAFVRQVLYSPDDLPGFFLTMSIPFVIVTVLCAFFHQEPVSQENDSSQEERTPLDDDLKRCGGNQAKPSEISCKDILSSVVLQLAVFSSGIAISCLITFSNNITIISEAVGFDRHDYLIYTYSIGGSVSRIVFGFLMDCFGTIRGEVALLYLGYITICVAMFIGFILLNAVSLFFITGMLCLFSLSILSVSKIMLIKIFGAKNYVFISGYASFINFILCSLVQLSSGLLYDKIQHSLAATETFCTECFQWVCLVLFSLGILSVIQHTITVNFLKSETLKFQQTSETAE